MLKRLSIRHVILIDSLDLEFNEGLSVFTGETGAGKSILLDSLSLVLGARSDVSMIQKGADRLSVTACFELEKTHPVREWLVDQGIEVEDEIILRRTVATDGRSKAYINEAPVTISFLKKLGDHLVEINGQFSSVGLLDPSAHLGILDAYGQLGDLKKECREAFEAWKKVREIRLEAEHNLERARADDLFLKDAIAELEQMHLCVGEEEELQTKRRLLMNREKIIALIGEAFNLLEGDDDNLIRQLARCVRRLEQVQQLSEGVFDDVLDKLTAAQDALAEASSTLESKSKDMRVQDDLTTVDDRLFALKALARKYHVCTDELPGKLEEFQKQLQSLSVEEESLQKLKQEEEKTRQAYETVASTLSCERHKAAHQLDMNVAKELPILKLSKASFKTSLSLKEPGEEGADGKDFVLFTASTNKNVELQPIYKIASGGELSRFMLALKVNLSVGQALPTIVFDEVDSGVGGATAAAVGARLAQLGKKCQVLVVTHSPQVASFGQNHYRVFKSETENCFETHVLKLGEKDRKIEIARMLSGEKLTQTAEIMAAELLEKPCSNLLTN